MKVIKPSIEITFFTSDDGNIPEEIIEKTGRTCYKSEDKITEGSAEKFVQMLRDRGHHAMLEFGYAMARIIADRGLTHELVRHRLASFAQESTRYCNYNKGKFGSEITVVEQPGIGENVKSTVKITGAEERKKDIWYNIIAEIEKAYKELISLGVQPQIARSILPIGIKSEIVIGANLREWRHIFDLRCAPSAHPIIRGIMLQALEKFYKKMPAIYSDLAEKYLRKD